MDKDSIGVPRGMSRGLGDTIAKITETLHIPQCDGCKKRQEFLNELVPYKQIDKKS